jgi:uncharacterized protein YpuA (DUF1002 family)
MRSQRAVALIALIAVCLALVAHQSLAQSVGKTIMLGESLSDAEREELLGYFEAGPEDLVQTVTIGETLEAMEGIISNPATTAYSSTALTCRELGEGLEVRTRNITVISPSLYAMALVTAGLGDGLLLVAAPNGSPAQGMTALTGVFKTWEIAPCESGNTTEARQRLALEELALAVEIAQSLGRADGIQVAGNLVLFTQQTVVIKDLKKAPKISEAVADQEAAFGVQIPAELRDRLVDLMVRLAAEKIDWSTFSAGWTIEATGDGTGIIMKGDGIAVREAQETATARADEAKTATAQAAVDEAATAAAEQTAAAKAEDRAQTATAKAEWNIQATATEAARLGAMTATAAAQPTQPPGPTPTPTATMTPIAVSGTIADIGGDQIRVEPSGGGDAVAYQVPAGASVLRDGESTSLSALQKGDSVRLVIDAASFTVTELSASTPSEGFFAGMAKFFILVPALAAIPLLLMLRGRGGGGAREPFVVKRVASA